MARLCHLALGSVVTSVRAFTFCCPRLPLSPTFAFLPWRLQCSPLLSCSTQMTWRVTAPVGTCARGDTQCHLHRSPGEMAHSGLRHAPALPGRRGLLPDPKPEMLRQYKWESWGSWLAFLLLPSCCRTSQVFPGSWCLLVQGMCAEGMKR